MQDPHAPLGRANRWLPAFFRFLIIAGVASAACAATAFGESYLWQEEQATVTETGTIEWKPEAFTPVDPATVSAVRYIDYENGDDQNSGTSTSDPWKHHPWDWEASGNAADHSGVTTYVFKRGVIYRGALSADESGTAQEPIRLTSDPNWGSGQAHFWGTQRVPSLWVPAADIPVENRPARLDVNGIYALDLDAAGLLRYGKDNFPERFYYSAIRGVNPPTPRIPGFDPIFAGLFLLDSDLQTTRLHLARSPDFQEGHVDFAIDYWHAWDAKVTKTVTDGLGNEKNYAAGTDAWLQGLDADYFEGGTIWPQYGDFMGTPIPQTIEQTITKKSGEPEEYSYPMFDPTDGSMVVGMPGGIAADLRYKIENLPQLLDAPGEFYVDTAEAILYYMPVDGADPNSQHLEFTTKQGTINIDTQSHIEISGLEFRYAGGTTIGIANAPNQSEITQDVTVANCNFDNVLEVGVKLVLRLALETRIWPSGVNVDNLVVKDCFFKDPWTTAVSFTDNSDGTRHPEFADLGHVEVIRNKIENSGIRHSENAQGNIPAIEVKYARTAVIAGNIIDRSYGSGIVAFGSKPGQGGVTHAHMKSIPLNRYLVFNNATRNTARAINDYGGLAPWQGGSIYVYNNLIGSSAGHMPAGIVRFGGETRNLSYPLYLDGGYKMFSFNNIIWGRTTDFPNDPYASQEPGYFSVFGFLNHFANNTVYRHGAGVGGSSGHKNDIVGNVFAEIEKTFIANDRAGDPSLIGGGDTGESGQRGVPTLAFGLNQFHGNADAGQLLRASSDPNERGGVTDEPDGEISTLAASMQAYPIRYGQLGAETESLPIVGHVSDAELTDLSLADFRLTGDSPARDSGADYFVPWQLYGTVGEWHFTEDYDSPAKMVDYSWFMYEAYYFRMLYEFIPTHDLTFNSLEQDDFVDAPSENWVKGAVAFDGSRFASHSDATMRQEIAISVPSTISNGYKLADHGGLWVTDPPSGEDTDGDGIPDEYADDDYTRFPGSARANPAISTENILLEAFFRIDSGSSGALIGKHDGATGYRLFVNSSGRAEFEVSADGNNNNVETSLAVNDGSWQHVLAEMDRASGVMNIYLNGEPVGSGGSATVTTGLDPATSIDNGADLLIGKANDDTEYLVGAIDFMRICHGTLADSLTTIEELYAWQTDGPFKRDIRGNAPIGQRDAGALEALEPFGATRLEVTFDQATGDFILTWQDNSAVEEGYTIQRSENADMSGAVEWNVGANVTSYTDSTASTGTVYYYRVLVRKAGENPPASPVLKAAIGTETPDVPTEIGFNVDGSQIAVEWDIKDPTNTFKQPASWTVKWTTTSGSGYSSASGITESNYTITGVDPAQITYVIIEAVNGADTTGTPEYAVIDFTEDFSGVADGVLPANWTAGNAASVVEVAPVGVTSPTGTPMLIVKNKDEVYWNPGSDMRHYAVEATLVRKDSNGWSRLGLAPLYDDSVGTGFTSLLKLEHFGNIFEFPGGVRPEFTPDAGETQSDPAFDVGEAWTFKLMTGPANGDSTSAVDLYFQLLDEAGNDRVDATANEIDEKDGEWYIIRDMNLPTGVDVGTLALISSLMDFYVDSVSIQPFVAPGVTFGGGAPQTMVDYRLDTSSVSETTNLSVDADVSTSLSTASDYASAPISPDFRGGIAGPTEVSLVNDDTNGDFLKFKQYPNKFTGLAAYVAFWDFTASATITDVTAKMANNPWNQRPGYLLVLNRGTYYLAEISGGNLSDVMTEYALDETALLGLNWQQIDLAGSLTSAPSPTSTSASDILTDAEGAGLYYGTLGSSGDIRQFKIGEFVVTVGGGGGVSVIAEDDSDSVDEGGSKSVAVLDNDTSATQIDSFTQGSVGSVSQSGNELVYTPNLGVWSGADSFDYTAGDGSTSDSATVSMTIDATNGTTDPIGGGDFDQLLAFRSADGDIRERSDGSIEIAAFGGDGISTDGSGDQFLFAQKEVSGDFTAHARVKSIDGPSGSFAGVMLRDGGDEASNATLEKMALQASEKGTFYLSQERSSAGGGAAVAVRSQIDGADVSHSEPEKWVMIERVGDEITYYTGEDDGSGNIVYTPIDAGPVTLSGLSDTVQVGLFTISGNSSDNATAVFDNYTVTATAGGDPVTTRYEAEDFTAQDGTTTKSGNGSTGSFQDYGASGTWIEWNDIDGGSGGDADLEINYAMGAGGSRYCDIYVNGESTPSISGLEFPSTGNWLTWSTVSATVSLNAGANTIKIEASPGSQGPNIDYMDVTVD